MSDAPQTSSGNANLARVGFAHGTEAALCAVRVFGAGWWGALAPDFVTGTMSRATVIPSGMLCTPIAVVTNFPCTLPLLPAHDTPTPSPSAKECIVMISSTSIAIIICDNVAVDRLR